VPFTVSHAVVALGARRLPVPVAAVAVGSMAPDAVLFAPFLPRYEAAHSWWGIPTIDLAVSLVVLAAWWLLVRPAWAPVVPGVRARVPRSWTTPPWVRTHAPLPGAAGRAPRVVRDRALPVLRDRMLPVVLGRVLPVVLGCVLGSVTHVVWDGFTHGHGFVVQAWPALREGTVGGYPLPFVLQDASSALGLAALLVAAAVWWRRTAPRTVPSPSAAERRVVAAVVGAVVLLSVVVGGAALLAGRGLGGAVVSLAFRVPVVVAVGLVVGAVLLLVVRHVDEGPAGH